MIEEGQSPIVDLPVRSAGVYDARPGVLKAMLPKSEDRALEFKTEAWRLYAVALR
jgi:hypothetical protein